MDSKILIVLILGLILGVVLVDLYIQEKPKNFEFEYKEYDIHLFNLDKEYKQYLKEGDINEELKNVFEDNNISLSNSAKIQKCNNPDCWKIKDNKRIYIIDTISEGYTKVREEVEGDYIKDVRLVNDTLIVEVLVTATCGDPNHKLFGDYRINGNDISLTISETPSYSQCMGYYNAKFKIKNLKKKDYKILFYTENLLGGKEKSFIDEQTINQHTENHTINLS